MEFIQENGLFVVIGCLLLMLVFFMMVAAAALMVARISGHSLMGPVLGSMLRALSIKNDADTEDIEEKAKPLPHRHIDIAHIKAESTQVDFERAVEKYRYQEPPAGSPTAQVTPQNTLPITPAASAPTELPVTPVAPPEVPIMSEPPLASKIAAPPLAPHELPVTPITAPELPESAFTPPAPLEPLMPPDAFTQPVAAPLDTVPPIVPSEISTALSAAPEIPIAPDVVPEIPTGTFPPSPLELSLTGLQPPVPESDLNEPTQSAPLPPPPAPPPPPPPTLPGQGADETQG